MLRRWGNWFRSTSFRKNTGTGIARARAKKKRPPRAGRSGQGLQGFQLGFDLAGSVTAPARRIAQESDDDFAGRF